MSLTELYERYIDYMSDALFDYMLPRRIDLENYSSQFIGAEISIYLNRHMGMSILCESWRHQLSFINHFSRNLDVIVKDTQSYARFCATYALELYTKSEGNIFKAFTVIASMVLELGVFCHNLNYLHFKNYSARFFSCIFMHFLDNEFNQKGAWNALEKMICEDVMYYTLSGVEVESGDGLHEIKNDWLRKYDSLVAAKDFESISLLNPPNEIDFSLVSYPYPWNIIFELYRNEPEEAQSSDVVANDFEDINAEMLALFNDVCKGK